MGLHYQELFPGGFGGRWPRQSIALRGRHDGSAVKLFVDGRAAKPSHDALRSRGKLSQPILAGIVVDNIMKKRCRKTETAAKSYVRATSGGNLHGRKRKRGHSYSEASDLLLSSECEKYFAACTGNIWRKATEVCVNQPCA